MVDGWLSFSAAHVKKINIYIYIYIVLYVIELKDEIPR